jgi:hypothetical protein
VHFGGGDIQSQYTDEIILNLMEELGIGYNCDGPIADSDDEGWQTELGQVLRQAYLEGEDAIRRWEEKDCEVPSSAP